MEIARRTDQGFQKWGNRYKRRKPFLQLTMWRCRDHRSWSWTRSVGVREVATSKGMWAHYEKYCKRSEYHMWYTRSRIRRTYRRGRPMLPHATAAPYYIKEMPTMAQVQSKQNKDVGRRRHCRGHSHTTTKPHNTHDRGISTKCYAPSSGRRALRPSLGLTSLRSFLLLLCWLITVAR